MKNPPPPAVCVSSLDQACMALETAAKLDKAVDLINQPGAAHILGVRWILEVFKQAMAAVPTARGRGLIDCQDQAGYAMTALKLTSNIPRFGVIYDGPAFAALSSLAEKFDVPLRRVRPDSLDLTDVSAPGRLIETWIGRH